MHPECREKGCTAAVACDDHCVRDRTVKFPADERHGFELRGGYAEALVDHLQTGQVEKRTNGETGEVEDFFVLPDAACAQLLYELTDDKRYLA